MRTAGGKQLSIRLGLVAAGLAAALAGSVTAGTAAAQPVPIGPAATGVHPGAVTRTDGAQCTANFVFTAGGATFLGQAAHCSGTGSASETDGCTSASLPLGTPVEVEGASRPGTLVYNSWLAMQAAGEKDPDACAHNDFALVRLADADAARTDPRVPFFGGPTGIDRDGTRAGDAVYSYGSSELRAGLSPLSPKIGRSLGDDGGGWTHTVATVSPGVPGDSGSAFLSADGTALGVLSTLNIAPGTGTNGVSDLGRMLDYARGHGAPGGLALATGGPFSAPL